MPGPTITRLLAPNTYEAFYRLAHIYAEDLLSQAAAIAMSAQLAARMLDELPSMPAVEQAFHSFRDVSLTLQETINSAFWPRIPLKTLSTGETLYVPLEIINRERWAPFDGAAWEQFFAALLTEVKPHISHLKERLATLLLPPERLEQPAISASQIAFLNSLQPELSERLAVLEHWLEPATLEVEYYK